MNPFSRRFSFWLPLLALALSLGVGCGARTPLEAGGGGGDDFDAGDSPPPVDAGMRPDVEILDAAVCGGECDDGVLCNGLEVCTAEGCVTLPPDCDDGDECTEDRCDPGLDECVHVPVDADRD
ncbi:MAG TPA: hypothetical protein RMI62_15440, partial [Polyangiaceae bacterium LLY-WYZ-15_(1-7)]|nr:hypothetical protein [Polyangiaceae bacterium LLY-WYZ-15_(1-7)]